MKSKSFAFGIAVLVVLASVLVYYSLSFHPENLGVTDAHNFSGYSAEKYLVNANGNNASYMIFRSSNNSTISLKSYESGYSNLSTFMILYLYKLNQTTTSPYTGISFHIDNASMYFTANNGTRKNIPVTIGRVGQSQSIQKFDFLRTLTIVKSANFLTMILRPNPGYLAFPSHGKVDFVLSLHISKIDEIGFVPFSAGNMNLHYGVNLTL